MQIISGSVFTSQDFVTKTDTGEVAQCVIGHAFVNRRGISELLLPRSLCPNTEALVLEMSTNLWKRQQKCAFSDILPWVVEDPPDWVEPKVRYLSSNMRDTKYISECMLFGNFDLEHGVFRIDDSTQKVLPDADVLIRRAYGRDACRYHGMTSEEATGYGFAAFQQISIDDCASRKGFEYWILKHPG